MRSNPQFSFLNPADPYHAYYRNRMEKVSNGEIIEDSSAKVDKEGDLAAGSSGKAKGEGDMEVDSGLEAPPALEFAMDLPTIAAIDLCVMYTLLCFIPTHVLRYRDVMKLTALFTAQRGRGFLSALSAREGRNYQFDFLRPTHSLFGYFNRLVEQYTKVINPRKEMLEQLQERTKREARWKTLEQAKKHAKWEQVKRAQDKKRKEDQEAERGAYMLLLFMYLISSWDYLSCLRGD
jgi:splicing factor 3A subunit 1